METLGALENDENLVLPGYVIHVSQSVACVPNGIAWSHVREVLLNELKAILPGLPEGASMVPVSIQGQEIKLRIWKTPTGEGEEPSFGTGRNWPGNPGADLILSALKAKVPKLSMHKEEKKILLLEKDAIAGTIESQFEHLPPTPEVQSLLQKIDEIWAVNTVSLESDSVIFTNDVWPHLRQHVCWLNLTTGEFWQRPPFD